MEHKTLKVGELKKALAQMDDNLDVLILGLYDGDLISAIGIDTESYKGTFCIKVSHTFPEDWFFEDEEGSRWDKVEEA